MSNDWTQTTKAIHSGIRRSQYGELSEALFMTQGYAYDSAESAQARFETPQGDQYIYSRFGNPTVAMFEDRMATLEGAEAGFATASGMAAVNGALMSFLKAGDHIVAARALFGSCLYILEEVLPRFGVEVSFVDGRDLEAWEKAITPQTKLVFFESISNPNLEVAPAPAIAKLAHNVGALVIVDNVFATPVDSQAIAHGADLVIYSTTKHIDGHGRCLGGIILGRKDLIKGPIFAYLKHTGGAISPFNAWVALKSLDTLTLRVKAAQSTALALSDALHQHPKIAKVLYPHHPSHPQYNLAKQLYPNAGTVLAVELKGGQDSAFSFLNKLKLFTLSNNLGDSKSLATHPMTTTHQSLSTEVKAKLDITEGLLRLSCGLEDVNDLLNDVMAALTD